MTVLRSPDPEGGMSTKAERSEAAAKLGRQGRGEAKRRGDAVHYAAIRLKREGTVTIEDMRAVARVLHNIREYDRDAADYLPLPANERVAFWLEREADRREQINVQRAKERTSQR